MSYKQVIKFSDRSEDITQWYYAIIVFGTLLLATIAKAGGWL